MGTRALSNPSTRSLAVPSARGASQPSSRDLATVNVRDLSDFGPAGGNPYPYTYPFLYATGDGEARDLSDVE